MIDKKLCVWEFRKKNKKRMKLIWGGMVMSDETGRPELYTTGGRVSIASFLIITTWNSGQVSNGRRAVAFEYEQKVGEFDDLIFFFRRISQKILFFRNVQFTGNVLLLLLFFRQYSILDGNLIKNISKFCCYCCFGIFYDWCYQVIAYMDVIVTKLLLLDYF